MRKRQASFDVALQGFFAEMSGGQVSMFRIFSDFSLQLRPCPSKLANEILSTLMA
jgi:hypothetical protein